MEPAPRTHPQPKDLTPFPTHSCCVVRTILDADPSCSLWRKHPPPPPKKKRTDTHACNIFSTAFENGFLGMVRPKMTDHLVAHTHNKQHVMWLLGLHPPEG